MKPEHTKPFNLEHAKAGAPYCQRNGLAARIGIWDAEHTDYPLIGSRMDSEGCNSEASWTSSGAYILAAINEHDYSLAMLPLGYCQEKPVFVGDELQVLPGSHATVGHHVAEPNNRSFLHYCWPRTVPVMPKSKGFHEGVVGDVDLICAIFIATQREEIEAYWKQLDEYERVSK